MSSNTKQTPANGNGSPSPAQLAQQMFQESPYAALRRLNCRFDRGVLTIAGRVPSFYLKQLAQTAIQDIGEVDRVENRVEVGT